MALVIVIAVMEDFCYILTYVLVPASKNEGRAIISIVSKNGSKNKHLVKTWYGSLLDYSTQCLSEST